MPLVVLVNSNNVVAEGTTTAADATSQRFTVKTDMRLWVDVNYGRPTLARVLHAAGAVIDTDDQATIDILKVAPEITHNGDTP